MPELVFWSTWMKITDMMSLTANNVPIVLSFSFIVFRKFLLAFESRDWKLTILTEVELEKYPIVESIDRSNFWNKNEMFQSGGEHCVRLFISEISMGSSRGDALQIILVCWIFIKKLEWFRHIFRSIPMNQNVIQEDKEYQTLRTEKSRKSSISDHEMFPVDKVEWIGMLDDCHHCTQKEIEVCLFHAMFHHSSESQSLTILFHHLNLQLSKFSESDVR
jgi:hypothetical protein